MKDPENIILYEFADEQFSGQIRAALGELFPVFEQRGLVKSNISTGRLSLDYCGFAASGKRLVTVLPKHLRVQISGLEDPAEKFRREMEEARKLYRLLKRNEYGLRGKKNIEVAASDFLNENSQGYTNELSIAEFILSDFQDNGIWVYNSKGVSMNADGETDWEQTVSNTDAVVSAGRPIYFNTYSSTSELITDSLITRIHKYAVNYCIRRYAFLFDAEMSVLPDAADDPDELGDASSLLYALEKQLRVTYRERDIHLLKTLGELVDSAYSRSGETVSFYGRRDFEQVWEAALQYCFGHDGVLRQQLFPLPEWFDRVTGKLLAVNSNDTLKPDVLRRFTTEAGRRLLILDAKYYLLNYSNKNTFPPVGDLIKQYFYEAAVCRTEVGFRTEEVVNAFIFPSQQPLGNDLVVGGHAKFDNDMFRVITDAAGSIRKPLLCYYADPEKIFSRYVRGMPFSMAELLNFTSSSAAYIHSLPA